MENKINLPPFFEGQRVVYVGTKGYLHSLPINSEHTVKAIIKYPCGCWNIDIGKSDSVYPGKVYTSSCRIHKDKIQNPKGITWFWASSFAPIEEKFESISYERVLEKEKQFIGVN